MLSYLLASILDGDRTVDRDLSYDPEPIRNTNIVGRVVVACLLGCAITVTASVVRWGVWL